MHYTTAKMNILLIFFLHAVSVNICNVKFKSLITVNQEQLQSVKNSKSVYSTLMFAELIDQIAIFQSVLERQRNE